MLNERVVDHLDVRVRADRGHSVSSSHVAKRDAVCPVGRTRGLELGIERVLVEKRLDLFADVGEPGLVVSAEDRLRDEAADGVSIALR